MIYLIAYIINESPREAEATCLTLRIILRGLQELPLDGDLELYWSEPIRLMLVTDLLFTLLWVVLCGADWCRSKSFKAQIGLVVRREEPNIIPYPVCF